MKGLHDVDSFKVLEKHEEIEFSFQNTVGSDTSSLTDNEHLSFCDFQQGEIANCGLVSALACLSQRPEFSTEIAPTIRRTSESAELHFKMFCEGEPIKVKTDGLLPFDEDNRLMYSRSARNNKSYLAALLEKAYVKQVCNKSYSNAVATDPIMVFSSFSSSMISFEKWESWVPKWDVPDLLKHELHNQSSVTMSVHPPFGVDAGEEVEWAHSYSVMDYDEENEAVKLYEPKCIPDCCASSAKLPLSLTASVEPSKGELLVTFDQLKGRSVHIFSLHAKHMYKSFFQSKLKVKPTDLNQSTLKASYVYKVKIEETSTFMINLFSYSNILESVNIEVTTASNDDSSVEIDYELYSMYKNICLQQNKGEITEAYNERFKLRPNTYFFSFELEMTENIEKEISFLLKLSSVSKCTFEESNNGDKNCLQELEKLEI